MRKILAALAAALVLAGCGTVTYTPNPVVTVTEQASPTTVTATPTATVSDDDLFISRVYQKYPNVPPDVSSAQLIELGQSTCTALDKGATARQIMDIAMTEAGGDKQIQEFFIVVVAAAVVTYCPEYQSRFGV